jgi:hypothetical protein
MFRAANINGLLKENKIFEGKYVPEEKNMRLGIRARQG